MDHEEIPSGWKMVRLDDSCELRKEAIDPTEYPDMRYVGLEHIDSGNQMLKRNGISSEVNSLKSRFYPGDILYGKLRPYLDKSVLVDFEGLCSTDILVLKPGESIIPQFLANIIHTNQFLNYAVSTSKGVNHPRTSWSSISPFQFLRPSIPEQRAIARALRAVQGAREARLRELALERERKAALMEHTLTFGPVPFDAKNNVQMKETKIGPIPNEWDIVKLGELNKVVVGYVGPINEFYTDILNGVPLLSTTNITTNGMRINEVKYVTFEFHNNNKKSRVFPGDIIVARHGTSGLSAVIPKSLPEAHALNVVIIKKNQEINSLFLCSLLKSDSIMKRLSSWKSGSVQGVVNTGIIRELLIPFPPLDQQQRIANILQACDSKIAALENEARLHEELFRAMLEELMSGRLSSRGIMESALGVSI